MPTSHIIIKNYKLSSAQIKTDKILNEEKYMHDCEPKSINELIKHLRKKGIKISKNRQKRQLTNQGYFHGYKGYRFFVNSSKQLPIKDYEQINKTILYDSKIKALFYEQIMYIGTSLKNICLDIVINTIHSSELDIFYKYAVESYKNSPSYYNEKQKRKAQENLMRLQATIHSKISKAYSNGNPKITHFYNNQNYSNVPLWAIFETLTMGDFGRLVNSLTFDLRDKISKKLHLNSPIDTDKRILCEYIFAMKELRNALAHNAIVYDNRFGRFRSKEKSKRMKEFLKLKFKLQYVNFKDIIDYVALITMFIRILGINKKETLLFLNHFCSLTNDYIETIGKEISSITINTNWINRIETIKNNI